MTNRVEVWRYFYVHTIEIDNLAFAIKVILDLKNTIPDCRPAGWRACRTDGEAGIRTSYSPVGDGTRAELGNIAPSAHKWGWGIAWQYFFKTFSSHKIHAITPYCTHSRYDGLTSNLIGIVVAITLLIIMSQRNFPGIGWGVKNIWFAENQAQKNNNLLTKSENSRINHWLNESVLDWYMLYCHSQTKLPTPDNLNFISI